VHTDGDWCLPGRRPWQSHRVRLDAFDFGVRRAHRRVHDHRKRPERADAIGRRRSRALSEDSRAIRHRTGWHRTWQRASIASAREGNRTGRQRRRRGRDEPPACRVPRVDHHRIAQSRRDLRGHAATRGRNRMSASRLIPPDLAKEIRALLPLWLGCVVLVWAGGLGDSFWFRVGFIAYLVGSAALGALSVGQEYTNGTLPMLLSLPISRRRMFAMK